MPHRARIDLETRLLRAHEAILEQAVETKSLYSRVLREARDRARHPERAGAALEVIATRRLYRLDRHATFAAFVRAELGMSRWTAHRLRSLAATPGREQREAEAAAREMREKLRALGIRGARVTAVRRGGAWRVEVVLRPRDVARVLVSARPRRR